MNPGRTGMAEVVLLPNSSLCVWEMGDPSLGLPLSQEFKFPAPTALRLTEDTTCSRAHVGSVMEPDSVALTYFFPVFPLAAHPGLSVALQYVLQVVLR